MLLTQGKIVLLTQGKIVFLTQGKIVFLTQGKIVLLTHGKIILLTHGKIGFLHMVRLASYTKRMKYKSPELAKKGRGCRRGKTAAC